jgi:hypothetical protein
VIVGASSGSGSSIVVLVALVVVAVLVRQGRLQSRKANLNRGERMRPLAITFIDPIISLVIIGPLLWRLVSASGANLAAAIAGGVAGVLIGYFRARVMFVRAERGSFAVVLRRSGVEYALVFLLIVLRSIEGQLELDRVSTATVVVSALAALGLIEAFSRAGFIIGRYVTHHELPTTLAEPDGSDPTTRDGGGTVAT